MVENGGIGSGHRFHRLLGTEEEKGESDGQQIGIDPDEVGEASKDVQIRLEAAAVREGEFYRVSHGPSDRKRGRPLTNALTPTS